MPKIFLKEVIADIQSAEADDPYYVDPQEEFKPDQGPWEVCSNGHYLQSDDFHFDVSLKISGDFTDQTRKLYAEDLCRYLNARFNTRRK